MEMTLEQVAALRARDTNRALSEAELADVLNEPHAELGTAPQDIQANDLYDFLLGTGEWGLIEHFTKALPTGTRLTAAGATGTVSQLDNRCGMLINFVRSVESNQIIRITKPAVRIRFSAILDDLVTYSFISPGSRSAIIAMSQRNKSWADNNGFPQGVTSRMVGIARGGQI